MSPHELEDTHEFEFSRNLMENCIINIIISYLLQGWTSEKAFRRLEDQIDRKKPEQLMIQSAPAKVNDFKTPEVRTYICSVMHCKSRSPELRV